MKQKFKIYLRTLIISMTAVLSLILSVLGVCEAFEGIREVGFGDKKTAIELIYGGSDNVTGIRILDFEFTFL